MNPEVETMAREGLEGGLANTSNEGRRRRRSKTGASQQHRRQHSNSNKSRGLGSSWLNSLQTHFPFILPTRLDGSQYEGYMQAEGSSSACQHQDTDQTNMQEYGEVGLVAQASFREEPGYASTTATTSSTSIGVSPGSSRDPDLFWLCVSDLPKHVGQRPVSSLAGAALRYSPRLADLLRGHRRAELVEKRLRESRSVLAFFHELHDIVERTSFTTRKERPSLPLHTFLTVAQEIKEIQQDYSPLGSKLLLENDKDGDDQAAEMISIKGEFTLLSDDLSSLEYTTCDESGREHALVIRIPPGYPQSPPQVASASGLPVEFTPHKFTSRRRKLKNYEEEEVRGSRSYVAKKSSDGDDGVVRVRDVVCCFEALVLDLQPFWEATDALDSRAWVLEPERPDRSCTHRRVLLNHHHVSMLVEFSPLEMGDEQQGFSTPFKQVSFLGASEHVERLEEQVRNHNINQSGDDLDLSLSLSPACGGGKKKKKKKMVDVVEHLEGMLGMKLPSRTSETTMEETTGMMCGICYSYKITRNSSPSNDDDDDAKNSTIQVPEIACENKNCGYLFHKECLLEWLQSDQSSRQTFNTMFGSCPYCSDPIVCKRTI